MNIFKNKKGSMQDILVAITVVFFFSICTYVGYKLYLDVDSGGYFTSPEAQNSIDKGGLAVKRLDIGGLFILLGYALSIFLLAMGLKVHPAFFILGALVLVLNIMVSGIYSNIFYEFRTDAMFTGVVGNFPIINNIMDNLPLFTLIMGGLLLIIMYGVSQVVGE